MHQLVHHAEYEVSPDLQEASRDALALGSHPPAHYNTGLGHYDRQLGRGVRVHRERGLLIYHISLPWNSLHLGAKKIWIVAGAAEVVNYILLRPFLGIHCSVHLSDGLFCMAQVTYGTRETP